MPGPLPATSRRRRNPPTIPVTALPVSGRPGRAPATPPWMKLGKTGTAWWRWAWKTPQACGWGATVGFESMIARRAQLEDDLKAVEHTGDLGPVPTDPDEADEWLKNIERLVRSLQRLAGGELAIMREMRELDDRLGLTPKGLAALRWTIVDDRPAETTGTPTTPGDDEVERARIARRARIAASS